MKTSTVEVTIIVPAGNPFVDVGDNLVAIGTGVDGEDVEVGRKVGTVFDMTACSALG